MLTPFGWAGLAVLALYLAAFFWAGALAARAAGRSIWLFGRATGRDRLAAFGFRAAFALALFGPLVGLALPNSDPLWAATAGLAVGLAGHLVSVAGAMIAFAAQVAMGASWRVGVEAGAVGTFVSGGLYDISRNPTFLGQFLLLAGLAIAIPSLPTLAALVIFWASAAAQIRSEESILAQTLGAPYRDYLARVPRWIGPAQPDRVTPIA